MLEHLTIEPKAKPLFYWALARNKIFYGLSLGGRGVGVDGRAYLRGNHLKPNSRLRDRNKKRFMHISFISLRLGEESEGQGAPQLEY